MEKIGASKGNEKCSEEERERIRESILNVFRCRLKSPSEGGGLLLGSYDKTATAGTHARQAAIPTTSNNDSVRSSLSHHSGDRQHSQEVIMISDSDAEQPSRSSPVNCRFRRVKRRKTRAELNRRHSKGREPENKEASGNVDFKRHLKRAAEAMQHAKAVRKMQKTQVCTIGQNRLTRRLGIFNQGKKSKPVNRVPVEVPQSVEKKVQEDIKNIITLSDTPPPRDPDSEHRASSISLGPGQSIYSVERGPRTTPPLSAQRYESNIVTTSAKTKTPPSSPAELPRTPPLADVARYLLEGLKPSAICPGRSLLRETREELCRLLRLQPSCETPTAEASVTTQETSSTRPTPVTSELSQNEVVPVNAIESEASQSLMEVEADLHQGDDVPQVSLQACMDARLLLHDNDRVSVARKQVDSEGKVNQQVLPGYHMGDGTWVAPQKPGTSHQEGHDEPLILMAKSTDQMYKLQVGPSGDVTMEKERPKVVTEYLYHPVEGPACVQGSFHCMYTALGKSSVSKSLEPMDYTPVDMLDHADRSMMDIDSHSYTRHPQSRRSSDSSDQSPYQFASVSFLHKPEMEDTPGPKMYPHNIY